MKRAGGILFGHSYVNEPVTRSDESVEGPRRRPLGKLCIDRAIVIALRDPRSGRGGGRSGGGGRVCRRELGKRQKNK